jgi:hypothetical protein
MRFKVFLTFLLFSVGNISFLYAQVNYYIDANNGNDLNDGLSATTPWQNLTKLYNLSISAGSTINLSCGSVWTGQQLKFLGSGNASNPIIINQYGTGAKPIIHGNGITTANQGVVYLFNQQYIEINNLEITNTPNTPNNADFFVGLYQNGNNPLGADRRGIMIAISNYGTANHIYLRNLNVHHVKGQLGSGTSTLNGAVPKRTGGIYFAVLSTSEQATTNSRFNDVLIDSCNISYCENIGLALDNEWNVYYPGSTEYTDWYNRRYTNIKVSNNIIHHIGKNAMIIRCTDETGLIEKNICYETALGTTGNTMFTSHAKGTVFQYNEGYYNRATTQTIDPGNIDGSMYDPDYASVGIIFQYSYSHDNSMGLYWGCNTRGSSNNTTGIPDPQDVGCTARYNVSQNDMGDLVYFNYSSAGNEIYNNVFYINSSLKPNIIGENSTKNHIYNFFNNIIYNLSSASSGAKYAFGSGTGVQTRNINYNVFYGNHPSTEPSDANKITANPVFLNPGTGGIGINTLSGYQILAGSPCINSGIFLTNSATKDFFGYSLPATNSGISPSRGIYEYTSALPVQLISFKAALLGASVLLNWQTTNEINNAGFMVQKSADGISYTDLSFVAAKQTPDYLYSFYDVYPLSGATYYRLKQVDKDGKFTLSSVVIVTNPIGSKAIVKVFPNPMLNNTITFQCASMPAGIYFIDVKDSRGNTIYSDKKVYKGTGELPVVLPATSSKKLLFASIFNEQGEKLTTINVLQ